MKQEQMTKLEKGLSPQIFIFSKRWDMFRREELKEIEPNTPSIHSTITESNSLRTFSL